MRGNSWFYNQGSQEVEWLALHDQVNERQRQNGNPSVLGIFYY